MVKENKASKLKASFLAKVSHELKTPIHGIMSLADYLEKNWDNIDENTAHRCITEINKSSHSLNFLIDTLFNLSKIQDNEIVFDLKKIDFPPVIEEAISMMGIYIANKEEITIKFIKKFTGNIILADKLWFRQVITNLLINSIKFTAHGQIIVKVTDKKIDGKEFYKFSVTDEGIGIPEEELSKIFDEYSSGTIQPNIAVNTGLGLAICEEIINAHNGKIWAANNEDKGVTIGFIIPKPQ